MPVIPEEKKEEQRFNLICYIVACWGNNGINSTLLLLLCYIYVCERRYTLKLVFDG